MKKDSALYRHFYHNRMLHNETQRESRVRENFTHGLVGEVKPSFRRKRGFTLIELLVVIAIISILALLLSPALKNAMDMSKQFACLSNLKQLYVAHTLYADDFNGNMTGTPRTPYASAILSRLTDVNLSYLVYTQNYLGIETQSSGSDNEVRTGSYSDVLTCPANPISDSWGLSFWQGHVSYTVMMGGTLAQTGNPEYAHPKISKMGSHGPNGPKMIVSDAVATTGSNPGFSWNWEYRNNHDFRGGNVLAGDGSSKWAPIYLWVAFGFSGQGTMLPILEYYAYLGSTGGGSNYYWAGPNGLGSFQAEQSTPGSKPPLFY